MTFTLECPPTARTRLGAVDLVPFMLRDAGQTGVELRDWERRPAALALAELPGWNVERVAHATGLRASEIREVLEGVDDEVLVAIRETSAQRQTRVRAERRAERVLVEGRMVHPRAPHGTANGYKNWSCRCSDCADVKAAEAAGLRVQATERRAT